MIISFLTPWIRKHASWRIVNLLQNICRRANLCGSDGQVKDGGSDATCSCPVVSLFVKEQILATMILLYCLHWHRTLHLYLHSSCNANVCMDITRLSSEWKRMQLIAKSLMM